MKDIIEALKGKKSFIIVGLAIVLGVLQGMGYFVMPVEGWAIITALFGGTMAAKGNRIAGDVAEAFNKKESDG